MPGFRAERVAEMIHRELAQRLRLEIKDPRVSAVSITKVDVTRDLSRAKVSYMPLGGGEVSDDMRDGLLDAAKRLRGPIGRALRLRHAPEIVFEYDQFTEDAVRMTQLLDKLSAEREENGGEG
jgi:ribosome-binding factor A